MIYRVVPVLPFTSSILYRQNKLECKEEGAGRHQAEAVETPGKFLGLLGFFT